MSRKKKLILWIVGAGGALVVGICVFYLVVFLSLSDNPAPSPIPFESSAWKGAQLYGTDTTRFQMHEDLIARYGLVGMSKEEVLGLLGPQSDPAYFREWDLRYWLSPDFGFCGFCGIDSLWLVMKLKDEKVTEYRILLD